ncbi:MAG: hypothetical protein V2B18_01550, partial [Pseudomonadota bacterium]
GAVEPVVKVTAYTTCLVPGFSPVPDASGETLCGNCVHFMGSKGCELTGRARVTSVSPCRFKNFQFAGIAIMELFETLQAGNCTGTIEHEITAATILFAIKSQWVKATPGAKRRLQRLIDMIVFIQAEEPALVEVVRHFSKAWGVSEETIRNYLREIPQVVEDARRQRRRAAEGLPRFVR